MTQKQKYEAIINAYEVKEFDTPERGHFERTILSDKTPEEVRSFLLEAQRNQNNGFDISYEIFGDATAILIDMTMKGINGDDFDAQELSQNSASVYTNKRLSWLNGGNQDEITAHVMNGIDIETACAIWYEEQVADVLQVIRDYIIKED